MSTILAYMIRFPSREKLSLLLVLLSASAVAESSKVIRLGHVNSLTGPEASFGAHADMGVRLAIREINESGGIKGNRVELESLDDQGQPAIAVTAITGIVLRLGKSISNRRRRERDGTPGRIRCDRRYHHQCRAQCGEGGDDPKSAEWAVLFRFARRALTWVSLRGPKVRSNLRNWEDCFGPSVLATTGGGVSRRALIQQIFQRGEEFS